MDDNRTQKRSYQTNQSEPLNRLAKDYLNSRKPFYQRTFCTPIAAQFFSLAILLFITVIYLMCSLFNQNEAQDTCNTPCVHELGIFQRGIVVDPQTLNVILIEFELNKILTPNKIKEIREVLTKKFNITKLSLLKGRLATAKISNQVLTERLNKTFLPVIAGAVSLIVKDGRIDAAQQLFPTNEFYQKLSRVIKQNQRPKLTEQAYLNSQSGGDAFQEMYALVRLQYDRERVYLNKVNVYINSMESYTSFEWLNSLPWVVQLIFWTWFGVLINNIVWLIRLTKNRQEEADLEYSPEHYITLFPRLVIAPFISIIFLAMISSGMASFDIANLNNLPAFLVAAFFLGFMSESITLRIRQFFNKLVDSIETQKQPSLSLAHIEPTPSFKPIANTSLSSLETNMRGLINNEATVDNIRNQIIKKARLDKE